MEEFDHCSYLLEGR